MTKVNSILNYIKECQDSIERLRHNVPNFTFNGFTVTVGNETRSGVEVQVITVFGIVNTELDEEVMDAIVQTVPTLNQSISSITVTDYGQIIKEPNAPIYYNQTIEIVTTNEQVDQLEVWGKDRGNDSGNFLVSDDIPEMPVPYSYKSYFYRVKSIYPDWSKDSADEQLEGNNEVYGDEVAHDSGHDLTEQEAKEILDNMLGKNEEFNALTDVLDKLFKAGTFPEDQPKTLKELIDKFQDEDTPEEAPDKKSNWDKITVSIPEEHLTLTDEDEFDITFDTGIDAMNTRVTVINIKGINNTYFFNTGHTLTLTTQAGDLAGDITTGFIADVEPDEDGLHVWVSEQLPTPSTVKYEREGAELKHEGINSDPNHTKEHNQHRPWEQAIREDIMARGEDPDDYVIQRSRNTPKCPKGEPGVEGMKTTIKVGNGDSSIVSDGDTITLNADKITLNGEEVPKADHLVLKGVKITLGDITLNADELVFDGHINLNESTKED